MSEQGYGAPVYGNAPDPGERWNVNLPAVAGVVFVFLVGVVIWVVARSGGTDSIQSSDSSTTSLAPVPTPAPTTLAPAAPPLTTSPPPLPPTTPVPATVPVTVPATLSPPPPSPPPPTPETDPPDTTAAPTTTAAATTTTAASGNPDLGVSGHTLQRPACDGGYITIIGSAVGEEATAVSMKALLDRYSGSKYLRTDLACPSLTQSKDGKPIYVAYFGPFPADTDACAARSRGPNGTYVKRLSTSLAPDHTVTCG